MLVSMHTRRHANWYHNHCAIGCSATAWMRMCWTDHCTLHISCQANICKLRHWLQGYGVDVLDRDESRPEDGAKKGGQWEGSYSVGLRWGSQQGVSTAVGLGWRS